MLQLVFIYFYKTWNHVLNTILDTCLNEFCPVSGLNTLKLSSIQWQCYNSLDLVLQMYEQKVKIMKCINHFTICSKPSLSSHIWTKEGEHLSANTDSWQVRLKNLYQINRVQGLNNYYTLQTLQGWSIAECYCKNDEKLLKKNLTNNVKYFYYNIINHTTECSSYQW